MITGAIVNNIMDNQNQETNDQQAEIMANPPSNQGAEPPMVVTSSSQPGNITPSLSSNRMGVVLYQLKNMNQYTQLPAGLSYDGTQLVLTLDSAQDGITTMFSTPLNGIKKVRSSKGFVRIYSGGKRYILKPQGDFRDFGTWLDNILPTNLKFMKSVKTQNVLIYVYIAIVAIGLAIYLFVAKHK